MPRRSSSFCFSNQVGWGSRSRAARGPVTSTCTRCSRSPTRVARRSLSTTPGGLDSPPANGAKPGKWATRASGSSTPRSWARVWASARRGRPPTGSAGGPPGWSSGPGSGPGRRGRSSAGGRLPPPGPRRGRPAGAAGRSGRRGLGSSPWLHLIRQAAAALGLPRITRRLVSGAVRPDNGGFPGGPQMQLDQEIQTLRSLLDSGEREGCARALADLRERYRQEPAAFDPAAIQALRDIAEALKAAPVSPGRRRGRAGAGPARPAQDRVRLRRLPPGAGGGDPGGPGRPGLPGGDAHRAPASPSPTSFRRGCWGAPPW